ncbi:hypothetical protein BD414DRAFT_255398 [Trametes punicea]|nr:hypothetical protein BD414DRAFT_255398 [Trametes punicea]
MRYRYRTVHRTRRYVGTERLTRSLRSCIRFQRCTTPMTGERGSKDLGHFSAPGPSKPRARRLSTSHSNSFVDAGLSLSTWAPLLQSPDRYLPPHVYVFAPSSYKAALSRTSPAEDGPARPINGHNSVPTAVYRRKRGPGCREGPASQARESRRTEERRETVESCAAPAAEVCASVSTPWLCCADGVVSEVPKSRCELVATGTDSASCVRMRRLCERSMPAQALRYGLWTLEDSAVHTVADSHVSSTGLRLL